MQVDSDVGAGRAQGQGGSAALLRRDVKARAAAFVSCVSAARRRRRRRRESGDGERSSPSRRAHVHVFPVVPVFSAHPPSPPPPPPLPQPAHTAPNAGDSAHEESLQDASRGRALHHGPITFLRHRDGAPGLALRQDTPRPMLADGGLSRATLAAARRAARVPASAWGEPGAAPAQSEQARPVVQDTPSETEGSTSEADSTAWWRPGDGRSDGDRARTPTPASESLATAPARNTAAAEHARSTRHAMALGLGAPAAPTAVANTGFDVCSALSTAAAGPAYRVTPLDPRHLVVPAAGHGSVSDSTASSRAQSPRRPRSGASAAQRRAQQSLEEVHSIMQRVAQQRSRVSAARAAATARPGTPRSTRRRRADARPNAEIEATTAVLRRRCRRAQPQSLPAAAVAAPPRIRRRSAAGEEPLDSSGDEISQALQGTSSVSLPPPPSHAALRGAGGDGRAYDSTPAPQTRPAGARLARMPVTGFGIGRSRLVYESDAPSSHSRSVHAAADSQPYTQPLSSPRTSRHAHSASAPEPLHSSAADGRSRGRGVSESDSSCSARPPHRCAPLDGTPEAMQTALAYHTDALERLCHRHRMFCHPATARTCPSSEGPAGAPATLDATASGALDMCTAGADLEEHLAVQCSMHDCAVEAWRLHRAALNLAARHRALEAAAAPECPVCLAPLREGLAVAPCGHVFHRLCVLRAAMRTAQCPTCRGAITDSEQLRPVFFG